MMELFSSRTIALIGEEAYLRLKQATVAVIGIGGVGGYVAESLARAGVGSLILADNDIVSDSNRNRQIVALTNTIGQYKTDVMKERIALINPDCKVDCIKEFLLPENISSFVPHNVDALADCIDTVTSKIFLAQYAEQHGFFIVSAMGAGNKLDATGFEVADIYKTHGCPLARVMRRELKARNVKSLLTVFSPEPPISANNADGRIPSSISYAPAIAGLTLSSVIIKHIAKL